MTVAEDTLLTQGPEAPELELTRMFLHRGLAFMVSEGTMQTSKGRKQLTVLAIYDIYETQPAWHANHKGAVVA